MTLLVLMAGLKVLVLVECIGSIPHQIMFKHTTIWKDMVYPWIFPRQSVVRTCDTLANYIGIGHKFAKYLKGSLAFSRETLNQ